MRIDIHHHIHFEPDPDTVQFQHDVLGLLHTIIIKENAMTEAMDNLTREVGEMADAVAAAVVEINDLKAQVAILAAGAEDPTALNDLAARLDTLQGNLAAVGPTPAPAPEEPPADGV